MPMGNEVSHLVRNSVELDHKWKRSGTVKRPFHCVKADKKKKMKKKKMMMMMMMMMMDME